MVTGLNRVPGLGIYEAFEDASNAYVVSEPLFGGDLTTLLAKAEEHGVTPTHAWIGGVPEDRFFHDFP